MITRIQILRYRCFNEFNVQWRRYNVLAGANGSGKSTLLDIPQLFSEILMRGLTSAFLETSPALGAPRAQSLAELTHRQRGGDFGFVLEAELPAAIVSQLVDKSSPSVKGNQRRWPHTLRYEIRFGIFNDVELQVIDEFLWLLPQNAKEKDKITPIITTDLRQRSRSWRSVIAREVREPIHVIFEIKPERGRGDFTLHLEPDKLALANIPHDTSLCPATVWFIELLTRDMVSYAPNIHELHKPYPPGQSRAIRADAANLPWMILNLRQENFEAWLEHIKTALPTITDIEALKRADDSFAYLKVKYQGDYSITSSGLSGGTLAILAYTILPYLTNPPTLVSLEEPENGVHPRAIEAILQSLQSLYDTQLWLSTHSPIVLAHTDRKAIIIMKKDENGGIVAIPGDQHPRLRDWSGGIDLGSLFATGILD
jgi:predicted ATPase